MIKRFLSAALTCVMLLTYISPAATASAEVIANEPSAAAAKIESSSDTYTYEDFTYDYNDDGTVSITEYIGRGGSVTIPDTINGIIVTSIGEKAFYNYKTLTSVTMPNSVTSIGNNAFENCANLKSISISNSVINIGKSAFSHCAELTSITIPDTVTTIGPCAFLGCIGLTSVTIPDLVTSIGGSAFSGCTGLTSIIIPESVTSINNSSFSGCTGLTSVTIPDSVTSIGDRAFYKCGGLTSVTLPNSVTSIEQCAFEFCTNLISITIPNSVSRLGNNIFEGCSKLTILGGRGSNAQFYAHRNNKPFGIIDNIHTYGDFSYDCNDDGTVKIVRYIGSGDSTAIPDTINGMKVTSIEEGAFSGCTELTSITIPDTVTSIGRWTFFYCIGLTSITLPDSVNELGFHAFRSCTGLTTVTLSNSLPKIPQYAFFGCTSLTSIRLPVSVTGIEDLAFAYCPELRTMLVPDTLKLILNQVFLNCPKLKFYGYQSTSSNHYSTYAKEYATKNNIPFYGYTELSDGTIEISDNNNVRKFVTLPDTINEKKVTGIANYAFFECTRLITITIPDSATYIGEGAFKGCTGLYSITIPDSVTSIGENAFYNCSKVKIQGKKGSAAETYANDNNIPFEAIDDTDSDAPGGKDDKDDTPAAKGTYGEIDGDGQITSADSLLILRQSVKLESFTGTQLTLCDVDGDNAVTAADALEVLRYSVKLPTTTNTGKSYT